MESIQFKMGKKAQTGRVLWGKQRGNKMEGTKYTQHKQTDNITCIIIAWPLGQFTMIFRPMPRQKLKSVQRNNT